MLNQETVVHDLSSFDQLNLACSSLLVARYAYQYYHQGIWLYILLWPLNFYNKKKKKINQQSSHNHIEYFIFPVLIIHLLRFVFRYVYLCLPNYQNQIVQWHLVSEDAPWLSNYLFH